MEDRIMIGHGSGGALTEELIKKIFLKYLGNPNLNKLDDAALITASKNNFVFSTDSFVVNPLFFPGGDIGKLAVYGTVNDLAVMGAKPLYLSMAFIIEESFKISTLEKILKSIQNAAKDANVKVITGDTKVVERGKADGIFITSSGIGQTISSINVKPDEGDLVLVSGNIAEHGLAIITARDEFNIKSSIKSDCKNLFPIVSNILKATKEISFIRDATRGGVAMVLNELRDKYNIGIEIDEKNIPIKRETQSYCDLLGFDPLTLANEGTLIAILPKEKAFKILNLLNKNKESKNASIIGKITKKHKEVILNTKIGGRRLIDKPRGEILPRIC